MDRRVIIKVRAHFLSIMLQRHLAWGLDRVQVLNSRLAILEGRILNQGSLGESLIV